MEFLKCDNSSGKKEEGCLFCIPLSAFVVSELVVVDYVYILIYRFADIALNAIR